MPIGGKRKAANFSRSKGNRTELGLRDYLRRFGYEANRVPLSGAAAGFKCDVIATKGGRTFKFEMKARRNGFEKVYNNYLKRKGEDGVWRFNYHQPIAISYNFDSVRETNAHFPTWEPEESAVRRTANKILRMQALLGEADYLVIKDNNRPLLFIRYWP